MQFAHINMLDRHYVMSAKEQTLFEKLGLEAQFTGSDFDTLTLDDKPYQLVYGKFICQAGNKDDKRMPDYITLNKGCGLFCITDYHLEKRTAELAYLIYEDIKLYEPDHLGWYPFAALIKAEDKVIEAINKTASFALECSFLHPDMEIILNLVNRAGLFALKTIEKGIATEVTLTKDNWLDYIDDARALAIAATIK